jgi:hypothetical protein
MISLKCNYTVTVKNVYDKWLGGAKDIDNLIFQCGDGARNSLDLVLQHITVIQINLDLLIVLNSKIRSFRYW